MGNGVVAPDQILGFIHIAVPDIALIIIEFAVHLMRHSEYRAVVSENDYDDRLFDVHIYLPDKRVQRVARELEACGVTLKYGGKVAPQGNIGDKAALGNSSQARGIIGTVVLDGYSEDELRSFAVFPQVVHQLLIEVAVRTERKIITPAGNRFEVEKTVKSKIGHDLFAVVNLCELGVQYGGVISALFQQACYGADFA